MPDNALLLEIKGNSLDDGPGIRSVVFLKGCPLDCLWCHNPESKRPDQELSFDPEKCIGCGTCISTCTKKAISKNNRFYIDREICNHCFDCIPECPSGAMATAGKVASPMEIVAEVVRDKPFFDTSNGGVTLSGGEPTLFTDTCSELLQRFKQEGIHTLLETCGQFDYERFAKKILPYTDMIYFDIKFVDESLHKKFCGISNKTILKNFRQLYAESNEGSGIEILPRTPLVPGMTAEKENLEAIARFLAETGARKAQLMAYNPLWHSKNFKIGFVNPTSEADVMQQWMDQNAIQACEKIFTEKGIELI